MKWLGVVVLLSIGWSTGAVTYEGPSARVTLLEIKRSFRDSNNVLYNWRNGSSNEDNDHCAWRGVTCDNFTIVKLDLSQLNLGGEISPMIGNLKSLESLYLKGNGLFGQIPDEIGNCSALKILDLRHNQLSGEIPRCIYQIEALQFLFLGQNFLVGTLSPDMCQLTRLVCFDVAENNLTGTIPDNIGDCKSFQILDLSYNQLTGEVPFNIGFLKLVTLALQGNKLIGRISKTIGLMQNLEILYLSDNHLTGTIPPTLGNLNRIIMLSLSSNNLTGSIPPELGNMTSLIYLKLYDNQLTGKIPPELGKLEKLIYLDLARNQLEGLIPENICSCVSLTFFNVHGNHLNGVIPLKFHKLRSLAHLDLSSNNINGVIPVALGLLSLQTLDLSTNQLSGPIPQELGKLQNLVSLILNNNNLSGEVPLQLTSCLNLVTLNLSNNNLSGNIPTVNKFTRFPPESFFGNPGLCGSWIGSHCGIYRKQSKGSLSTSMIVSISLASIISLCVIMIILYYLLSSVISSCVFMIALYYSYRLKQFTESSESKMGKGCPSLVILHMDMQGCMYEDIMRITENLNEKYMIGNGATSKVYKCVLSNCKPIAIKRLHTECPENLHAFETELKTLGNIKHRNLVSLQGYSLSPHGNLLLYDYMVNGSLWNILHGSSNKLDWNTRLRIAVGTAQGLKYLHHCCNPRIIHRDVKTSNILLDENFEAHLGDFGIAKCIPDANTHISSYVMGTIGYIDPEYARTLKFTEKSDVYSYGIVLLELVTRRKALDNDSNLLQLIQSKVENNSIMDIVDPEVVATCTNLGVVRKVFELALFCSKGQRSNWPTMDEVARYLQSLLPMSTQVEVSEQTN